METYINTWSLNKYDDYIQLREDIPVVIAIAFSDGEDPFLVFKAALKKNMLDYYVINLN